MKLLALSLLLLGACTIGLEQDFDLTGHPTMTPDNNDVLFDLVNTGGNAPEPLDVYRIDFDDQHVDGGLFAQGDHGDAQLLLAFDANGDGIVDPQDVVRASETPGFNLTAADHGRTYWINVMVLSPSQRAPSDALTKSWQTVWSSEWHLE